MLGLEGQGILSVGNNPDEAGIISNNFNPVTSGEKLIAEHNERRKILK